MSLVDIMIDQMGDARRVLEDEKSVVPAWVIDTPRAAIVSIEIARARRESVKTKPHTARHAYFAATTSARFQPWTLQRDAISCSSGVSSLWAVSGLTLASIFPHSWSGNGHEGTTRKAR